MQRPNDLTSELRTFSIEHATWVASQFVTVDSVQPFSLTGNINLDAFDVKSTDGREFILQRLNTDVFTRPANVMDALARWCEAQERAVAGNPDLQWEPVSLVATKADDPYLDLDGNERSVWRMLKKIQNVHSYKSLGAVKDRRRQLTLATETGKGLAISTQIARDIPTDGLVASLPGYRDTSGYLQQLRAVLSECRSLEEAEPYLPTDPLLLEATRSLYIVKLSRAEFQRRLSLCGDIAGVALSNAAWATGLQRAISLGMIPQTVIHGDPKIENFLYTKDDRVRSLVDLDTIMPHTWLVDWGDLVRSLVNLAGETETETQKVQVDAEVYERLQNGFASAHHELSEAEHALMPRAVETITLELGIRFLNDFLRGDDYFQVPRGASPDLNLIRARVQFALFDRLRTHHGNPTEDLLSRLTSPA